jgi:proline dehydrogenase
MQSNKNSIIDFSNSEIAFKDKSDKDLKQTYLWFKVMNNSSLVKLGKRLLNFAFTIYFPVKGFIKRTIYKIFVGGTSIEDCANTLHKLSERNVGSILDYALEGEEVDEIFDATCLEIQRTIRFAHSHDHVPFSAFKITGIGRFDLLVKVSADEVLTEEEADEYQRVLDRVDSIFKLGYELDVPILIDAEETWIQPMLDDLVMEMMAKYNTKKAIVQNTYQMYRHDSIDRLIKHHQMALDGGFKFGLKIVRGAYMEKERERAAAMNYPSPIQPDKAATDRDFDAIINYLVDNADTIDFMVATHNEESSQLLATLIDQHDLPRNCPQIYFAQLYGMSDNLTFNLAEKGYNVVKYVPYGEVKTMMPYLFRRAEENTSVKGQSSRELLLIKKELERRKLA